MKELRSILRAALRAAVWKSTPDLPPVNIGTVLIWAIAAMAAEAARQYFAIDDAAFSLYGVNTIIAETAVLAAVALLFFSGNRTAALAQLFALSVVAACVAIVANRLPAFGRSDLTAGMWTATDTTILIFIVLLVWWTVAVVAILRGVLGPYESPFVRALGLTAVSVIAIAVLPAFPTFVGGNTDRSSYNLWEWAYAKFVAAERETAPRIDVAALELSQPSLLDAEVRKLLPERKGTADIYAIGIAGWSDEDVFIKELNGGFAALDKAIGLDRGAIRLVNHASTTETLPIADRMNFALAVQSIAKIMNKDEDILLIFITSHGGPTGVGLRLTGALSTMLSPDHIATVLDREGIKNRLLIVSACYSGVFVKRLASPDSVILTAADENSASFGCSNEREWTYFGDAFFNQNLAAGVSLEEAFENAKVTIGQWEARDDLKPSNPQGFFGSSLSEKLRSKLRAGDAQHALAGE